MHKIIMGTCLYLFYCTVMAFSLYKFSCAKGIRDPPAGGQNDAHSKSYCGAYTNSILKIQSHTSPTFSIHLNNMKTAIIFKFDNMS